MASHPDSGALAEQFACGYEFAAFGTTLRVHADCFEWMSSIQEASIHAIVTDPPYGVKEYDFDQLQKRSNGDGGIWRIPPSFDGNERSPLPRFTALSDEGSASSARVLRDMGTTGLACFAAGRTPVPGFQCIPFSNGLRRARQERPRVPW